MNTNALPAIHPGEFLRETLQEMRISQARFARAIGVSPMRVSHVAGGTRPVTAELALLFGKALGQSPEYWLNLQADYDLKLARLANQKRLATVIDLIADAPPARKRGVNPASARPARESVRKSSA